jgi:hypothetical protein
MVYEDKFFEYFIDISTWVEKEVDFIEILKGW